MATKKRKPRGIAAEPPREALASVPAPAELPAAEVGCSPPEGDLAKPVLPVVGIGASAGGLDAFKRFFRSLPADSGLAFVVLPHLDPTHESFLVNLLAQQTALPILEAGDGMSVAANHVYILSPNKYLTIRGGTLILTGPVARHGPQTSIDVFLRSLAEDQQEQAICIILSGTGSHGTLGLKAVKARGGMAMVQDPATAAFDHMPQSAIATDLADYILPPEQMPEALIQYVQHCYVNRGSAAAGAEEAAEQLDRILALLRVRTHTDFRCYRKQMLARRIARRMGLNHLDQLPQYLTFLHEHPEEVQQLARDLLISVTSFFRDPEAFYALETHVVPQLVQTKEAGAPLRVWVAGCATGEEAYSIALLLLEQWAAAPKTGHLQVFATDVDARALEIARVGIYAESIAADVSPERLGRFFTPTEEHSYQVTERLREVVTFAVHDLLGHAPLSKLDLISCRNLLIYLEPDVQQKVLALMHFALSEGGYLLLGPSETVGPQVDLFEPVSKQWRVYRRLGPSRPERVSFPIVASREPRGMGPRRTKLAGSGRAGFAELTQQLLLAGYAPAAVLISRRHEVLYFYGPTWHYLEQPTGEPTQDLLVLARAGLRTQLRAAVHQAVHDQQRVTVTGARIQRQDASCSVRVTAQLVPSPMAAEGLLLVTFEDEPAQAPPLPHGAAASAEEALVRHLEDELTCTRQDLQSTIEEMASSTEELQASKEEVLSMNEELQSANEELKTSQEGLQSLNEELTTVNHQLQDKVEELERANNDLANLLTSTDIATVFLDLEFRIQRFTPAATKLLNLSATDVGRPLSAIAPRFTDAELRRDGEEVLRTVSPREREVPTPEGGWCLRRILPYRTWDNKTQGLVITFVDVTALKATAERLRRLAAVLLDSNDAVTVHDFDGRITAWNRGAERMYGYTEAEALALNVAQLVPQDLRAEARLLLEQLRRGERVQSWATQRLGKDGRLLDVWLTVTTLQDDAGKPVAVATTERDITEGKWARQKNVPPTQQR